MTSLISVAGLQLVGRAESSSRPRPDPVTGGEAGAATGTEPRPPAAGGHGALEEEKHLVTSWQSRQTEDARLIKNGNLTF